jgi:hypothetical protein
MRTITKLRRKSATVKSGMTFMAPGAWAGDPGRLGQKIPEFADVIAL